MRTAMTEKELAQFLKDMELGTEQIIMAIDGEEDDVMPDLAMGVIKEKYFDSDTTTFLAGVYGSDYEFRSFFAGDYDDEDTCIENVINWFNETGNAFCGVRFNGLYIKPTDEEEQEYYEENKYNGDIVRTVDTLEWGEIDLVARFDVDDGNFYDCYQRDGGGYLGEFRLEYETTIDDYTDKDIEISINTDMETGW